jgi:hypothetical protein
LVSTVWLQRLSEPMWQMSKTEAAFFLSSLALLVALVVLT